MKKHATPTLTLISPAPRASRRPEPAAVVPPVATPGDRLVVNGGAYRIARALPSSTGREVYAAERAGQPVVVKTHARLEAAATRCAPIGVTARYIDSDRRYLVREWLEGRDLNAVLPLVDASDRAPLMRKLAEALRRLHGTGIVHGDVRAWNVWLSPSLDSVRLLNFDWSLLDGQGYDPSHHGPRPAHDTAIDWEAYETLERFVRARTRQPHHDTAWRADADSGDLAGRMLAERCRIVDVLAGYAGLEAHDDAEPREVCYLRMPGADDLFTVADRVGVTATGERAARHPFQGGRRTDPHRAESGRLRVALREYGERLPDAGYIDLAIVALGAGEDGEAFAEAARQAYELATERALFVLSGARQRSEAAMAVTTSARRVCPQAVVEAGTFGPWTRTPDYVLVDFDGPDSTGVTLRKSA